MKKQNFLSRSELARRVGVSPATVTRLADKIPDAAKSGKKIDAAHPDVAAWIENAQRKEPPPAATGLDPLYEDAAAWCAETGRWSITGLRSRFSIGHDRAKRLLTMLQAAGLDKRPQAPTSKPDNHVATEPPPAPPPKMKGRAVEREKKKDAAAADNPATQVPERIQAYLDWTLREILAQFGTDVQFLDYLKATKEIELITERRLKNAQAEGVLISRDLVKRGVIDAFNEAHIKLLTDGVKTMATRATAIRDAGGSQADIENLLTEQVSSFIRPVKNKVARALRNA